MDKKIIEKRVIYITNNLEKLKEYLEDFENSESKQKQILQSAIERVTEQIVESAININIELLKSKNIIVNTYYESFESLQEFKLFDENLLKKLANTAGFRNRLAHDYMDLDDNITIESAKNILKIYPGYLEIITREFV